MKILDQSFEGHTELAELLSKAGFASIAHAVFELSVFAPPSLISETRGLAIVNAVRSGKFESHGRRTREQFLTTDELKMLFGIECSDTAGTGSIVDDNLCPHLAFTECFSVGRHIGSTQLAHIFPSRYSKDPRYFTALPNLMLTPWWLAKFTDDETGDVARSLRWAIREIYDFCPEMTWFAGGRDTSHRCTLCSDPPDDAISLLDAKAWFQRSEGMRTTNYHERLAAIKAPRWKRAVAAGNGYTHIWFVP